MILSIANHLWQSTLFLALAAVLSLVLRSNGARTRYWLWFASSVKFLLPYSLLVALGHRLSWLGPTSTEGNWTSVVMRAVRPVAMRTPKAQWAAVITAHHPPYLAWVLSAVWAAGACGLVIHWLIQWRRLRDQVRSAMPIQLGLGISVRASRSLAEPGIVGIFNPVLLLPAGITDHLTPGQLQGVLAHELEHVRCRDNLTAMAHMAVEAIFWFFPPVWWVSHRLLTERERACDEAALFRGADPADYAEGILGVCRLYLALPLRCAAGVSGSNLARRIAHIMSYSIAEKLSQTKKVMLLSAGSAAIAAPVLLGVLLAGSARAQPSGGSGADPMGGMDWLATTSGESSAWYVTASRISVGATLLDPTQAENLRLSHGNARFQADHAEATNFPGQQGHSPIIDWRFTGHVRIEFAGGVMEAESVTAQFNGVHVTITTPNGHVTSAEENGPPGSTAEIWGALTLTLVATEDNLNWRPGILTVSPPALPPSLLKPYQTTH